VSQITVFRQLDSADPDLAGHGCGAFALLSALDWMTDGSRSPEGRVAIDKAAKGMFNRSGATMKDFRERGLTMDECKVAWEATPKGDRTPFRMQRRSGVRVRDQLIPQLAPRKSVALVAVRYADIQKANLGSPRSDGGFHYVLVFAPRETDDTIRVADPLRRRLTRWPIDVLVEGMENFGNNPWKNGKGEAGVIKVSPSLLAVARAQRDRAKAQRDAARAQRDAARARVKLLEAQFVTQPPADAATLEKLQADVATKAAVAEQLVQALRDSKKK
jgi:hypothetical protein